MNDHNKFIIMPVILLISSIIAYLALSSLIAEFWVYQKISMIKMLIVCVSCFALYYSALALLFPERIKDQCRKTEERKMHQFKEMGYKVKAKIVSVEKNSRYWARGEIPLVINCQWYDEKNNVVYMFQSAPIWSDFQSEMIEGLIDVWLDPADPADKYYVDRAPIVS